MLCHSIFLLDVFFNKFIVAHHCLLTRIMHTKCQELKRLIILFQKKEKKKDWINNHFRTNNIFKVKKKIYIYIYIYILKSKVLQL